MSQANEIRQHVFVHHIEPAREKGLTEVEVLTKVVRQEMDGNLDPTAIMGALTAENRLNSIRAELVRRIGTGRGWQGVRYRLLEAKTDSMSCDELLSRLRYQNLKTTPSSDDQPIKDIDESWRKQVLGLSPSEFQELAREYLKAKGFADAEIEIVIKMKA